MSRKKKVVKRMLRQALTEEAMSKMEKKRALTHVASDEEGAHVISNHHEIDVVNGGKASEQVMAEKEKEEDSGSLTEYHGATEHVVQKPERRFY